MLSQRAEVPFSPKLEMIQPELQRGLASITHGLNAVRNTVNDVILNTSIRTYQAMLGVNSSVHHFVGETFSTVISHIDGKKTATAVLVPLAAIVSGCMGIRSAPNPVTEAIHVNGQVPVRVGCKVALEWPTRIRSTPIVYDPDTESLANNQTGSIPKGNVYLIEDPFIQFGPAVTHYAGQGKSWPQVPYIGFFDNNGDEGYVIENPDLVPIFESPECDHGTTLVDATINGGAAHWVDDKGQLHPLGQLTIIPKKDFNPTQLTEAK